MGNCNCDSLYSHLLFTTRKRSLRRLRFHRCLSVHGGCVCIPACTGADTVPRTDTPHGQTPNLTRHPPGQTRPLSRRMPLQMVHILVLLLLYCNEWPISCFVIIIVGPITGVNVPSSYSTTHYSIISSRNRNRVINLNCEWILSLNAPKRLRVTIVMGAITLCSQLQGQGCRGITRIIKAEAIRKADSRFH